MMYASPIDIKREPQLVRFHKEIELPDELLTLKMLSEYVTEEETFAIGEVREGFPYYIKNVLHIYGKRLETAEEMELRIAKQEKYNENYYKHQAKYGRKKDA